MLSSDPNEHKIDKGYIPKELRDDAPEVEDTYEEGALSVFGLGPSRLDLEHSQAAKRVAKYQPQEDRVTNGIVIIARRHYLEGLAVSPERIVEEWDATLVRPPSIEFVTDYVKTQEFKNKLGSVGATYEKDRLTSTQEALITTLTYPDGKSLAMKLKKHKIPWVTFQGWLRNPKFLSHLKLTAEQALSASEAFSLIQLVQQASAGSNKAIDTVLAMTGRWDPNNRKQVDAQKMIGIILQVLDEEIKDPELKTRIGSRLSLLSSQAESAPDQIQGELSGDTD